MTGPGKPKGQLKLTQNQLLAPMDPLIGKTIFNSAHKDEGYHIESLKGAGGRGKVYVAHNLKGELRALKFAPTLEEISSSTKKGDTTPTERKRDIDERFLREAGTLMKINHPNVVKVYGGGGVVLEGNDEPVQGLLYISMEYIDGMSLSQLLEQGPVLWPVAQSILLQVCDALTYVHERGIVHRDIKPENIMLGENGAGKYYHATVIDFGSVRVSGASILTMETDVIGTLHYIPPEQLNHSHDVGPKSDMYSLGSVMYEILAGKGNVPFAEDDLGPLTAAIVRDRPIPLNKRVPDRRIPRKVGSIVLRTLEKKPENRYPDIRALGADISSCKWNDKGPSKRNPFLRWAAIAGITTMVGAVAAFGPYVYLKLQHPQVEVQRAAPVPKPIAKPADSVPPVDTIKPDTATKHDTPSTVQPVKKPVKIQKKAPSVQPKKPHDSTKTDRHPFYLRYSTPAKR